MDTPARLLCVPFAGAGAGFFNAWRRLGSPVVDPIGVQLPGREHRLREPPVTTVADAVTAVLPMVEPELAKPGTIGIFGHSSGSVIAFELARHLDRVAAGRIARLFVSGARAPWRGPHTTATGLPDEEFIASVQGFAGFSHPALSEPRLRRLVLPALRADVEMHETYRVPYGTAVEVPVTAIRGRADSLVSAADTAEWAHATHVEFQYAELPGEHMYLIDRRAELFDLVAASLRELSHDR